MPKVIRVKTSTACGRSGNPSFWRYTVRYVEMPEDSSPTTYLTSKDALVAFLKDVVIIRELKHNSLGGILIRLEIRIN